MTTLTQKFTDWEGNTWSVTHIYSPAGHFERDGFPQGWHIQLGTNDTAEHYTEVTDGSTHTVPESLPDIYIEEPEEGEEATAEEVVTALEGIL